MLTKQLSDFLYEVRYESLPSKAVDNAKLYLEDLLGVAAAGSVQPQGGIWRSYFAAGDGQQEATAWNSGLERLSCEHAAALNARAPMSWIWTTCTTPLSPTWGR